MKGDVIAMKSNDAAIVNETADKDGIPQSNRVIGFANKFQLHTDRNPWPMDLPASCFQLTAHEHQASTDRQSRNPQTLAQTRRRSFI